MNTEDFSSKKISGLSPTIIIGSPRSGTSIFVKLMDKCSFFIGYDDENSSESALFRTINMTIMKQGGAHELENPEKILAFINANKAELVDKTISELQLDKVKNFISLPKNKKDNLTFPPNKPWGWKDPQTVFLLDIWLTVFPEAKLIYIVRHGVDVANSLQTRFKKWPGKPRRRIFPLELRLTYNKLREEKKHFKAFIQLIHPKNFGQIIKNTLKIIKGRQCKTMKGAFDVWIKYITQAEKIIATLPEERVLIIRYEELLSNPMPIMKKAISFSKIPALTDDEVKEITSVLNISRKFAYKKNKKHLRFSRRVKSKLAEKGY